jgi:hypothetical protein
VCAVLDDLVIALYVTVDELVGLRRGPACQPRGKSTGDQLRSEVSADVANSSSDRGASRPAALTDGVEDVSMT